MRGSGSAASRVTPAPELVWTVVLALVGTLVQPFAPDALPLHWGLDGYDNLADSWVPLIVIPWCCVALSAYVTTVVGYASRTSWRQAARVVLVVCGADLLVSLTYMAVRGL